MIVYVLVAIPTVFHMYLTSPFGVLIILTQLDELNKTILKEIIESFEPRPPAKL